MKNITIIGTGYVGLVTGTCFAEKGHQVTCLDIDSEKINALQQGHLPFYEPDLAKLVTKNVAAGRLRFTDSYDQAIRGAQVCFLALPTPSLKDGSCDISYLLMAIEELAQHLKTPLFLVNKSTSPVGTAGKIAQTLHAALKHRDDAPSFEMISNPEFLREGSAVSDCLHPDRIVLGVSSEAAAEFMKELYAPFSVGPDQILIMDIPSAELAKYACNAMLATRVSFMNNLALFCEKVGANVEQIRRVMGGDPRIGEQYLRAGIGFGGSCLPKDVQALRSMALAYDHRMPILDSVLQINQAQLDHFFDKIVTSLSPLSDKTIAMWGLSFKPDTDDLRAAPALFLIEKLLSQGARLQLFDPIAMSKASRLLSKFEKITFCQDEYAAAQGAHALVLTTEWKQFQCVDFDKLGAQMQNKLLFDGRNQYQPSEMQKHGFHYMGIGIPPETIPLSLVHVHPE